MAIVEMEFASGGSSVKSAVVSGVLGEVTTSIDTKITRLNYPNGYNKDNCYVKGVLVSTQDTTARYANLSYDIVGVSLRADYVQAVLESNNYKHYSIDVILERLDN